MDREITKTIDISVILVNYNSSELTEKCIQSLLEYKSGFTIEIIIIDNNSKNFEEQRFLSLSKDIIVLKI